MVYLAKRCYFQKRQFEKLESFREIVSEGRAVVEDVARGAGIMVNVIDVTFLFLINFHWTNHEREARSNRLIADSLQDFFFTVFTWRLEAATRSAGGSKTISLAVPNRCRAFDIFTKQALPITVGHIVWRIGCVASIIWHGSFVIALQLLLNRLHWVTAVNVFVVIGDIKLSHWNGVDNHGERLLVLCQPGFSGFLGDIDCYFIPLGCDSGHYAGGLYSSPSIIVVRAVSVFDDRQMLIRISRGIECRLGVVEAGKLRLLRAIDPRLISYEPALLPRKNNLERPVDSTQSVEGLRARENSAVSHAVYILGEHVYQQHKPLVMGRADRIRAKRKPHKRDGPGHVYVHRVHMGGGMPTMVKIGHSVDATRRLAQHRRQCRGVRFIRLLVYWTQLRIHAERVLHDYFDHKQNAWIPRVKCTGCPCTHTELFNAGICGSKRKLAKGIKRAARKAGIMLWKL
ncbi:hypothetical protein MIND_01142300 [Mycena indigotica]|uniref:Bacteriophage T5 Orf172 DNA-binding domain-containing protein n=1 Tax=Mycena indigotica TaxID=2126181 RepID=A0A8H6S677_9AGAR|nr:uncharacterized protein MIND_01142300 [Mycena indigotica]KAF7293629.1 hypothetical protein MIND_01142300 [Mycena indigotica]